MPGTEPTLRELAAELRANLANVNAKLDRIETQVNKTNGRVTSLETDKAVKAALAEQNSLARNGHRWMFETAVALAAAIALALSVLLSSGLL